MKELEILKQEKKGLIIHHWDTDGLSSAALLLRFFRKLNSNIKIDLFTPTINNFFLKENELENIKNCNYDFIITCDINFPEAVVNQLAEIRPARVFVFDHHKQDPIKSVFYHNKPYPSCTLVIREYLETEWDLLSILGAIGDKEEKIQEDKDFWPKIKNILDHAEISFTQSLEMRQLIDSCYMADDYMNIQETIKTLEDDPLEILNDQNLKSNLERVNAELKIMIDLEPKKQGEYIYMFNLESGMNILSHATRGLSRKYKDKVIISYLQKQGQTNIYIRRRDIDVDLSPLIKWARSKDLNSGGKQEVVGIIFNGNFSAIEPGLLYQLSNLLEDNE